MDAVMELLAPLLRPGWETLLLEQKQMNIMIPFLGLICTFFDINPAYKTKKKYL